jgi:hypothetical protein
MNDSDTVVPGANYVADSKVVVCPATCTTVAPLKSALSATTVTTFDAPGRRTQMWEKGKHAGTDVFLT